MAHDSPVYRYLSARLWWIVFFVPLAFFAPAIWSEYGWRDDYAMLRESVEAPGAIWRFAAAQGRPVYGWLLEASFHVVHTVPALVVLRTLATLLIGGSGLVLGWILLRYRRWSPAEAAAAGAAFTLLPSPQVVAGWAVAWPHALAGLCGLFAYVLAEEAWRRSRGARAGFAGAALVVFITGALCYPSNALLYVVPVAAGWLRPDHAERRRRRNLWLLAHLGFLGTALLATFVVQQAVLAAAAVEPAARLAVETDPAGKLAWFATHPLGQALALFVVHDQGGRNDLWFFLVQAAAFAAIVTALGRATGWEPGPFAVKVAGLAVLCLAAHAVSLVAAERWATYRTTWALSGVVLVAAWLGLRSLQPADDPFGDFTRARRIAVLTMVTVLGGVARWNTLTLIAEPQQIEWRRFVSCAASLDPANEPRVFVISPQPSQTRAPIRHLDEFGSYSADADWPAKEMFIQALKATHPRVPEPFTRVAWHSGYVPPVVPENFDRVMDLRPRS